MIDDEIAENFLRLVADSATNGVPEMHFRLWRRTTEAVRDQHLAQFRADPAAVNWFETGYLAEDPDFDALIKLAKNTLGYLYARHIIDNNLRRTIASDYRRAHERLQAEGQLEGMPDEVRYAILRSFQIHDIFHILTGYLTNGRGEIAIQAFSLAQLQLPYFSIWMATLTAQMTFCNPAMTPMVMDAITQGWQLGRNAKNLNFIRWEERLGEPIDDLRREFAIPSGLAEALAA